MMTKEVTKKFISPDSLISLVLGLAVVLMLGTLVVRYISNRPATQKPEDKQEQTGEKKQLPTEHVVVTGETLWSISEKYFQTGYNFNDIARENKLVNPDKIEVGQKLVIPDVKPIILSDQISAAETTVVKPKDDKYTVQKGDTLWAIAANQYNDGFKWVYIAKANNLVNPGLIHAGNVFNLPSIP